jgi:hypothetical protein
MRFYSFRMEMSTLFWPLGESLGCVAPWPGGESFPEWKMSRVCSTGGRIPLDIGGPYSTSSAREEYLKIAREKAQALQVENVEVVLGRVLQAQILLPQTWLPVPHSSE